MERAGQLRRPSRVDTIGTGIRVVAMPTPTVQGVVLGVPHQESGAEPARRSVDHPVELRALVEQHRSAVATGDLHQMAVSVKGHLTGAEPMGRYVVDGHCLPSSCAMAITKVVTVPGPGCAANAGLPVSRQHVPPTR